MFHLTDGSLMIVGFKTVSLAWANKTAMIGYTWFFLFQKAGCYEGRLNAGPKQERQWPCLGINNSSMFSYLYNPNSITFSLQTFIIKLINKLSNMHSEHFFKSDAAKGYDLPGAAFIPINSEEVLS